MLRPPYRKKISVKTTSRISVTISPTVAAVVSAPAVIDVWFAFSVLRSWAWKLLS